MTENEVHGTPSFVMGNEKANVAICTLWTPANVIAGKLNHEKFSVCANLYTIEGINTIIRGLLANPSWRHLALFGVDSLKAGNIIYTFFEQGVDENNTVNGTSFQFHHEIPASALELLRKNVVLHDFRGKSVEELVNFVHSVSPLPPWGKPLEFPMPSTQNEMKFVPSTAKYQFTPDPKGNFVIQIKEINGKKQVVLAHYSNGAIKTGLYFTSDKETETQIMEDFITQLIQNNLISTLDHAFYLGKEIQKALIAIKQNKPYTQDSPLV